MGPKQGNVHRWTLSLRGRRKRGGGWGARKREERKGGGGGEENGKGTPARKTAQFESPPTNFRVIQFGQLSIQPPVSNRRTLFRLAGPKILITVIKALVRSQQNYFGINSIEGESQRKTASERKRADSVQ